MTTKMSHQDPSLNPIEAKGFRSHKTTRTMIANVRPHLENNAALHVGDKMAERRRLNGEPNCQTAHVNYMDARVGRRADEGQEG